MSSVVELRHELPRAARLPHPSARAILRSTERKNFPTRNTLHAPH